MTAQQIGERGHRDEHKRESEVVALAGPAEQHRVGGLVDGEAARGDDEETRRSPPQCGAVPPESEQMVAGKRHREGEQPAGHVGHQRPPAPLADQHHHDAPMHRRGGAADGDEEADALSRGKPVHVAREHSRARTLCICVDDFGLHAGINEAALRLAAQDRVHAIGCLVGGEAWGAPWTDELRHLDPGRIDVGLHLDFTEFPLLPRSRRRLPWLIVRSLLHQLDASDIRAEIRAQLDAFEQVISRRPAFVDGHQHVHQLPVIRRELLAELAYRYHGAWPWLRSTRAGPWATSGEHWRTRIKALCIDMLGATAFEAMVRSKGFAQNQRLLGVYDFKGGPERYRTLMAAWIRSVGHADLLMCHPALSLHESDPIGPARLWEYEVLAGADFAAWLRDAAVALAPMSRILSQHGVRA
jgi:chitin disaccharide deacetylase